ncbi:MAG: hypothetical protein HYU39_02695 [Thaumarchaeota archaeon]|nr:hypothetical protein [Nitrososphaerota archaeon]
MSNQITGLTDSRRVPFTISLRADQAELLSKLKDPSSAVSIAIDDSISKMSVLKAHANELIDTVNQVEKKGIEISTKRKLLKELQSTNFQLLREMADTEDLRDALASERFIKIEYFDQPKLAVRRSTGETEVMDYPSVNDPREVTHKVRFQLGEKHQALATKRIRGKEEIDNLSKTLSELEAKLSSLQKRKKEILDTLNMTSR